MGSGTDMIVKVLFQGDVSALPVRQFSDELGGVEAAAGRATGGISAIGPAATAALATAGVAAATALAAGLLSAADAAAKAERKIIEVGTLMGGLTKGQMREMSDELGRLTITSGQAFDSLAKAKYDIVSAGFANAADSAKVLDASARLAVGSVADIGETGKVVTALLNAYGKSAGDAADVTDDLFTIVKQGVTTMPELSASLGQVIAIAANGGVSIDELGASIAALTATGQPTAVAVTSVGAAISELSRPSNDLAKALKAAHVESTNLIQSGHGLTGALNILQEVSEKTDIPLNQLLQREEALRAVMPLLGKASQRYADDLTAMANNAGAADEAFRQMGGSADLLKDQAAQAFEMAKRKAGEAVVGSQEYQGVLRAFKGIFEGVALDSASATKKMLEDTDNLESGWIAVGVAIKGAFAGIRAEAGKLQNFLDSQSWWEWGQKQAKAKYGMTFSEMSDQYIKIKAAKGPQIADFAAAAARLSPEEKAKPSGLGVREDVGVMIANASRAAAADAEKAKAARLAAEEDRKRREEEKKLHPVISGTTSRMTALSEAARAAAEGQRLTEEAVGKATEWYGKLTEAFPGLYDEIQKQEEAQYNLALLVNQGAISLDTFNIAVANGASALDTFKLNAAIAEEAKNRGDGVGTTRTINKLGDAADALMSAGNTLGGRVGSAFSSVGNGLSILGADTSHMSPEKIVANQIVGYATIVSGVGQAIGGTVGSAISNTASMAATGATLAVALGASGPIGAVVGGVIGLASSIFGGAGHDDDHYTVEANNASAQNGQTLASMADSGGALARLIYSRVGYDATAFSDTSRSRPSLFSGLGIDQYLVSDSAYNGSAGLFYNIENDYNASLLDYISAMDTVDKSIKSFASTSIVSTLDDISYKYDEIIAKAGDLASVEQAKLDEQVMAVTGVTGDTIAKTILDAIDNNSAAQAGEAFVDQYDAAIKTAIRSMAVSQLVNDVAMPLLGPVLQEMTSAMLSGTFTSASMAGYLATATSVMDQLSPMITALAQSFGAAGVSGSSASTSRSASNYRSASDYALALAGVPGYADGGSTDAGFKIVGERGWELMHTSPGRVISHEDSSAMLDNRQVVAQLEKLREENRRLGETLIKRVLDLEAHYDKWDARGLKMEVAA